MTSRFPFLIQKQAPRIHIPALVDLITVTQLPDGAIPWSVGDKTDPWDHVESAMGLTVGGAHAQARRAYDWLRREQLADGSWYAAYKNGAVSDRTRETNHAAYIAVGVYHYYLTTADREFVAHMWPAVDAAMEFVLRHQASGGEIYWAVSPRDTVDRMALLTGCSSIFLSLKCALALARAMGAARPNWRKALERLQDCIQNRPQRFNMTKSRFSMDWFYPILSGAIRGSEARVRIDKYWKKFIIQNMGARCVSDQPWVTIAETSELVIALEAMGNRLAAHILFSWIMDHRFDDGTFWCGITFPDMVLWPEERITWTNAVVLLAADCLYDLTPAAGMFRHDHFA